MNSLKMATADPKRNRGSRIISKKISSEPKLIVEGNLEMKILRKRWNRVPISVELPEFEPNSKKGVINDFNRRKKAEKNLFALVDMDYDFEQKMLPNDARIIDTSPLVTLPSHAFPTINSSTLMMEEISKIISQTFENSELIDECENIVYLARSLTILKLFKGRMKIHSPFGEFSWKDINFTEVKNLEFLYHIIELELGSTYLNGFDTFMKDNKRNVDNCGINDHMLFHSLKMCFCNIFDNNMNDNIFRIFEKDVFERRIIAKISTITNDLIHDIKQKILSY